MAMGLPVLHGVAGESARIVMREDCGVLFESEDEHALASLILTLAADPARRQRLAHNGQRAAIRYSRVTLASEMLRVLEGVAVRRAQVVQNNLYC